MAYGISNVNPAASALNNKLDPNPLGRLQTSNANAARLGSGAVSNFASGRLGVTPPKVSPAAQNGTLGNVPTQPLASKTISPSISTTPPAYSGSSGLLTDYGRSKGLPEVNAPKATQTPPTAPPVPPQAPTTQSTPTFPGLVGSLVGQAGGLNTQAGKINETATQIGQFGQMTPEEIAAREKLAKLKGEAAGAVANIETHPSDLNFQMGREAVLGRNVEAQKSSLADQIAAFAAERSANTGAFQGQATAQQGAGGLINSAGGLIGNATGYAAPQAYGLTTQPYNPLSDSYGGGGTGGVLNRATLAGQVQGAQALGAAPGSTAASNIQTGGTAATSAAASGLQDATRTYVDANTAYTTAQSQGTNLQQTMAQTGINTNPQFVNQKINALQSQLGSANYAAFITALNEAKQAYTNLLSSVGAATPTVNGQQATDIFGANSTPAQISAAIEQLNKAAYAKLQPLYDRITTYQQQLSSGSTGGSGASGGASDPLGIR